MKAKLFLFAVCFSFANVQAQTLTKIKQINSGSACYDAGYMELNGHLLFSADDGVNGRELWTTDGTLAGTFLLKDINAGSQSSNPSPKAIFNNKLYFTCDDGVNGWELWMTDGTAAGTQIVKNIDLSNDGIITSSVPNIGPGFITIHNSLMYFVAYDSAHGYEPWISDGTPAGTHILKDIDTTPNNQSTILSKGWSVGSDYGFWVYNNLVYFSASTHEYGFSNLWVTDGTSAGTLQVTDSINIWNDPGYVGKSPVGIVNGKMVFEADRGLYDTVGTELYISDGTKSGTALLKNIALGSIGYNSSYPDNFYAYNGKVYFRADDRINGKELWVTDGTPNGTMMLADIDTGTWGSLPGYLTGIGNYVYFTANTPSGSSILHRTDGTASGTSMAANIWAHIGIGYVYDTFAHTADYIYMRGNQSGTGVAIYRYNINTGVVSKIEPAGADVTDPSYSTSEFTKLGNDILFSAAFKSTEGYYLWRFSENTTGVEDVMKLGKVICYPNPASSSLYVTTATPGKELVIYDVAGRKMMSRVLANEKNVIDISSLSAGVYLYEYGGERGKLVKK